MGTPNLSGLTALTAIGPFYRATGTPDFSDLRALITIDRGAFYSATGTPNLSTAIGPHAFYGATGKPDLPGVTIGQNAFGAPERRD